MVGRTLLGLPDLQLQVMDAAAYIAGISTERPIPFRMQSDIEIGAGTMHSGKIASCRLRSCLRGA